MMARARDPASGATALAANAREKRWQQDERDRAAARLRRDAVALGHVARQLAPDVGAERQARLELLLHLGQAGGRGRAPLRDCGHRGGGAQPGPRVWPFEDVGAPEPHRGSQGAQPALDRVWPRAVSHVCPEFEQHLLDLVRLQPFAFAGAGAITIHVELGRRVEDLIWQIRYLKKNVMLSCASALATTLEGKQMVSFQRLRRSLGSNFGKRITSSLVAELGKRPKEMFSFGIGK